jgi:hypothetical protein
VTTIAKQTQPSLPFTDRELKLLRLFLDPAASTGEIDNASSKFVRSLRSRGVRAEAIEAAIGGTLFPSEPEAVKYSRPDYGRCRMPFGCNKGKRLFAFFG